MISKHTKALFWLSTLPLIIVACSVAGIAMYTVYLEHKGNGQETFFIVFHLHLLRLLGLAAFFFVCGLISLLFVRRMNGAK